MKKIWTLIAALAFYADLYAADSLKVHSSFNGDDDWISAVVVLTGAESAESLDEEVLDRFERLRNHPLQINSASRKMLSSSGLLSLYQIAALADYMSVSGDVLSITELAMIDGFGDSYAKALAPFISLSSDRLPGSIDTLSRSSGSLSSKVALKSGDWSYGMKYRIQGSYGRNLSSKESSRHFFRNYEAGIAAKSPWGNFFHEPSSWGGFVSLSTSHLAFIFGDFNTRFGQGVALWNGFTLSGVQAPSSFYKRPTGLSPSLSSSGSSSQRGTAAEYSFKRLSVSGFVSFPELRGYMDSYDFSTLRTKGSSTFAGANISWLGKYGQLGVTGYGVVPAAEETDRETKISADARFCLGGNELFGEVVYDPIDKVVAAAIGAMAPIGRNWTASVMGRYYPYAYKASYSGAVRGGSKVSDEIGAAAALKWKEAFLSIDALEKPSTITRSEMRLSGNCQLKVLLSFPLKIGSHWTVKSKITTRLRNYDLQRKTGIRIDVLRTDGPWQTTLRGEASAATGYGLLGYLETGRKGDRGFFWVRTCAFRIDNWDDRIYVYERTAPGNFSVPACYGRGMIASAYCGKTFSIGKSSVKTYLRSSLTAYPFMSSEKHKPSVFQCSIQTDLKF